MIDVRLSFNFLLLGFVWFEKLLLTVEEAGTGVLVF